MSEVRETNRDWIELAESGEFVSILKPGAPAFILDAAAIFLLWASEAAAPVVDAMVIDETGTIDQTLPAIDRLTMLAEGLAPLQGMRLEKLKLTEEAPAFTCACRRVTSSSGEEGLLVVMIGPIPKRAAPAAARPPAAPNVETSSFTVTPPSKDGPSPSVSALDGDAAKEISDDSDEIWESDIDLEDEPIVASTPLPNGKGKDPIGSLPLPKEDGPNDEGPEKPRAPIRFLWEMDADGRFTSLSNALANIVGDTAGLIGKTWDEAVAGTIEDPSGIVAEFFRRRETWSNRPVFWRIGKTDEAVRVDLAGMPVYDAKRHVLGFRGFGLCRPEIVMTRPMVRSETNKAPRSRPESVSGDPIESEDEHKPDEADTEEALTRETHSTSAPDPRTETIQSATASAEPVPSNSLADEEPDDAVSPEDPLLPFFDGDALRPVDNDALFDEEPPSGPEEAFAISPSPEAEIPAPGPSAEIETVSQPSPVEESRTASVQEVQAPPRKRRTVVKAAPAPDPKPVPKIEEQDAVSLPVEPQDVPFESHTIDSVEASEDKASLSPLERSAFREIARALGARLASDEASPQPIESALEPVLPAYLESETIAPEAIGLQSSVDVLEVLPKPADPLPAIGEEPGVALLGRLPVPILIAQNEIPVYLNRACLDLIGFRDCEQLIEWGGLGKLFLGRAESATNAPDAGLAMALATRRSGPVTVEIKLVSLSWRSHPASLMLLRPVGESDLGPRLRALELEGAAKKARMHELSSILDTATDGVIVLDEGGRILSLNRSAEALFGYGQNEVTGETMTMLLAPESHGLALDYLEGLRANGVASVLNDGREVLGRVRQGGTIPLFMTMGSINEGEDRKFCAVLRDITAFKKAERELIAAKRSAEDANAQKSDFLAKISHEIRTPLNAIIGFAEVIQEERFGPVGNERYKDYLNDIRNSGAHLISLVNDLLDLAKIEAGRLELSFVSVNLNELVAGCVSLMQPQAARERIVMRTSFAPKLPPVVADERSMRQIILNLVSNAVKFTEAGGQIIVSTALTDRGEAAFRVRDTGIGMTEKEVAAALEPFRQIATSRRGGGTGLGLPLTKALVEANRGALQITSTRNEGTLVEVLFPPTRVLAE